MMDFVPLLHPRYLVLIEGDLWTRYHNRRITHKARISKDDPPQHAAKTVEAFRVDPDSVLPPEEPIAA